MRNKIWKWLAKVGILFAVITGLLTAISVPAMAQAPFTPLRTVQGKVIQVATDHTNFVIQNGTQKPVTVSVDSNTRYYEIPMGRVQTYINDKVSTDIKQDKGKQTTAGAMKELHIPSNWSSDLGWLETFDIGTQFSNVQIDDRVIARTDTHNLARQVLIIKAPVIQTIKGNITAVTSNSLTINTITINVDGNTRVTMKGLLAVQAGQYAAAVYNKNTMVAQTIDIQPPPPAPSGALTSIAVKPSSVSGNLSVGGMLQFGAIGKYANGVSATITSQVTWSSSDTSIATISTTGLAKGVSNGTTNIYASENGTTSSNVLLTVGPHPPSVGLHTLEGKVMSLGTNAASFTLQNGSQRPVAINADANTKYYLIDFNKVQMYIDGTLTRDNRGDPKNDQLPASLMNDLRNAHIPADWMSDMGWLETFMISANLSNIAVGDRVSVSATNDRNNLAKQIIIFKVQSGADNHGYGNFPVH